jgi:serine/threonine protein kinase
MPTIDCHPSRADLEAFALGRLHDDIHTAVEEHVNDCSSCQLIIAQTPGDGFVTLLRLAGSASDTVKAVDGAATMANEPTDVPPVAQIMTCAWTSGEAGSASDLPAALKGHPRYEPTRLLGSGGMGTVWLARHRLMGREVAVKVIRPEFVAKPGAAERFRRETQAAARLNHPNIVTAFDADNAGDTHLLAMEYVEGVTLADLVRQRGPLPVTEACDAVRQAALGLQHAFECGLIHRDLKPHNLIRTADGSVKILDFGLAGLTDPGRDAGGLTAENVVLGTPDYIAPEQAEDARNADIRSDVYSLGCTLYHLLTGRVPFPGDSVLRKLDAHRTLRPEPIRNSRPEVPAELAAIVTKMMAKKPDDRFQSPGEVAAAMGPFVGEWVPAPKRRRSWLPLAAVLLFASLAAAGLVYRIQTDNGEVVINVESPDVEVVLLKGGKEVEIIDTKMKKSVRVPTGDYDVVVKNKPDDIEVNTDRIVVSRGQVVLVKIERVLKPEPVRKSETGKIEEIQRIPISAARDFFYDVAVSNAGKYALVTKDIGNGVRVDVYNVQTGEKLFECPGFRAEFLGDGKQLVVCNSRAFQIYEAQSGKLLRQSAAQDRDFWAMVAAPGGKHVVYFSGGGCVLFDLSTMKEKHHWPIGGENGVQFSAEGKRLFLRSVKNASWLIWDVENNREADDYLVLKKEQWFRLLSDGKTALSVRDGNYVLLDAATGELLKPLRPAISGGLGSTFYAAKGRLGYVPSHGKNRYGQGNYYAAKGYFSLTPFADGSVRLYPLATAQEPVRYDLPADDRTPPNDYVSHTWMSLSSDDQYAALATRKSLYVLRLPPAPSVKDKP